MYIMILFVIIAFFWLMDESHWLTIRLLGYTSYIGKELSFSIFVNGKDVRIGIKDAIGTTWSPPLADSNSAEWQRLSVTRMIASDHIELICESPTTVEIL